MGDSGSDDAAPSQRNPNRPLPRSRIVPAIDPTAPLDPGLQLTPEELAAQAAKPPPPPSRRFVVGTAGLAALAAAGGAGYSFWRTRHPVHHDPPAVLVAAAEAEHALLAYLDEVVTNQPQQRAALAQLRRDHAAHATALEAALSSYSRTPRTPQALHATPDIAALRTVEQAASQRAARQAAALQGEHAVLLASIAACEATHVELLR